MPRMSFHWLFAWLVPLTLGISFNISSSKNPFLTSPSANPTYILHSTYQAAIMHSFTWFTCLLSVSYTGMQASAHQGSCPTSHCCMLTAKKSAWYIRNTGSIDSLIFYFVCLCICLNTVHQTPFGSFVQITPYWIHPNKSGVSREQGSCVMNSYLKGLVWGPHIVDFQ